MSAKQCNPVVVTLSVKVVDENGRGLRRSTVEGIFEMALAQVRKADEMHTGYVIEETPGKAVGAMLYGEVDTEQNVFQYALDAARESTDRIGVLLIKADSSAKLPSEGLQISQPICRVLLPSGLPDTDVCKRLSWFAALPKAQVAAYEQLGSSQGLDALRDRIMADYRKEQGNAAN